MSADPAMFAVFSSTQNRPVIRDWYKTKAEAEEAVPDFKRVDRETGGAEDDEYFVAPLTSSEVEYYRASGFRGSRE